jgi:DNA polymerase III alpha subunit
MIDKYGQVITSETEAMNLLYHNPTLDIGQIVLENTNKYESALQELYSSLPKAKQYVEPTVSIEEFDKELQQNWYMPDEYKQLDIAKWVLDQCSNDEELQRAGQELLVFQKRDLLMLLNYMKYLVDTMRNNNIIWGVGRGSSVGSFVLYKIGINRINPIYYRLDFEDFLN